MRDDEASKGLASGIDELVPQLYRKITLLSVWGKIDELGHADLDELAWELNVEWYDATASLSVKKQLIKMADLVHSRLGTKWAVEQVVAAHFGSGEVQEWFEYGGEPHHFKILSENSSITAENMEKFMRILGIVKRKSSWLESIIIKYIAPKAVVKTAACCLTGQKVTIRPLLPKEIISTVHIKSAVHTRTGQRITITPMGGIENV